MRRRARNRAKGLVADSTTALNLDDVDPLVPVKDRGAAMWEEFRRATPFWWTEQDLAAASMLCAATDVTVAALRSTKTSPAGKAALLKEWRSLAGELGLSPTSRGRLKLTEAQSAVAAQRVEAIETEQDRRRGQALDLDDLGDD